MSSFYCPFSPLCAWAAMNVGWGTRSGVVKLQEVAGRGGRNREGRKSSGSRENSTPECSSRRDSMHSTHLLCTDPPVDDVEEKDTRR